MNISNGAALDLAGGAAANTVNFGSKNFKIVGTGTGTSGVIFNTGNSQFTAFENITLTGDATIGGVRFDIGRTGPTSTLDLAGHKLTVTMNNGQLFGVESFSTVTSGTIEVTQGALDIERTAVVHSDVPGSNIILDNGTNLQLFETVAGGVTRPIIANGNNIIGGGSNNTAILDAPISFTGGDLNIQQQASGVASGTGTGTLIVNGNITEFGGQFSINKSGPSTLVLAGSNTFSHALNINGGTVVLGNVNALGPTPSVNLNGNGLRLGGTSISIPQLSGGGVVSNGNATPATLTLPITTGNTYGIDAALQDGAGGGALSLTVAGGGTVSLHAATNTFSGTTTISAGTLEVQNSLSNGPVVNNSALYFTNGGTLTYGGGISGGGIVRQTGGGTTILSGAHTFNSALQIDNGTVIVNGSLLASGTVNLNTDLGSPNLAGNGSVGNVRIGPNGGGSQVHISPGAAGNNSVGSLTMTSLAVAGGNPDFTLDLVTPANSDFINVAGNATFSVASTLSPSALATPGTYTVLTAAGGLTLGVLPTINQPTDTRTHFTLDTTSDPKSIKLVAIGNALSLTWRGDNGESWDVNNTVNWTTPSGATDKFFQADNVIFDDSASDKNVNVGTAVFPSSVTVANSAGNDYNFNGGGTISGATGFTKSGTGAASININNNYTGTTTLNDGTLAFNSDQSISGPIVVNGGTLIVGTGGTSGSIGSANLGTNNGVVIFNKSNTATLSSNVAGTGSIQQVGNGALALTGSSTFSGGVTQSSGQLNINNAAALGTGTLTITGGGTIDNTSGATVTVNTANAQVWGTNITFTGTNSLNMGTGSVTLNTNPTITVTANTLTLAGGLMQGSGNSITKAGVGTLALTGSGNYTGATTINAGTLIINNVNSLGDQTSRVQHDLARCCNAARQRQH